MGNEDFGFTFHMGQALAIRAEVDECEALGSEKSTLFPKRPIRRIVIERHLQECHGGVQRKYLLRSTFGKGLECVATEPQMSEWTEPELVAFPDTQ
jgi:hypothetical protein